jgi:hypothetical protein
MFTDPSVPAPVEERISIERLSANDETNTGGAERRKWQRYKLSIPVCVTGFDHDEGRWQEETNTIDCSRTGLTVRLGRRVRLGLVLHLFLPLPVELRSFQQAEPNCSIYGVVRRVEPAEFGMRVVALEFIGEQPPPGYDEIPWATYRTEWDGAERRREPRELRCEPVIIEYFDDLMQPIKQAAGVTEDLSLSGAKVYVTRVPENVEWIKVSCLKHRFDSYAVVRNRFVGVDGYEYLCLQFVDSKWVIQ